jgi:hypothetical protein
MLVDNNRINGRDLDTLSIVNIVFVKEPLPPYTYSVLLSEHTYNVTLFQLLMNILICGAKKIYGEDITADNITKAQLETLQRYMMSIGYIIKYNYTYNEENIPIKVNIWFEPYMFQSKCNGIITF